MLKIWRKIVLLVLMAILVLSPVEYALGATKLSLYNYNTKKNVTYTGQQVKYTLDGKTIGKTSMPGIIVDGTALGSYYEVFNSSGMKVSTKYNKAKGTVTLKKNGNTVVVTIGSKKAIVNGKSVNMSVAPMKVQYKSNKITRILVPTRFIAENLGYTYVWTSSSSTAALTTPFMIEYNGKMVNYIGTIAKVSVDGKNINLGNMPNISINGSAMVRAKQVYSDSAVKATYHYNSKTKVITLKKNDNTVKMTIGSKTATVNGVKRTMSNPPLIVTNVEKAINYVMVPASFTTSALGYDYKWNSTTKTSMITTREEEKGQVVVGDGPELGDESILDHTELTLKTTHNFTSIVNFVKKLIKPTGLTTDAINYGYIYDVVKDSSVTEKDVFQLISVDPMNSSTITQKDNVVSVRINNTSASAAEYSVTSDLVSNITTEYNSKDSSITFNFILNDKNSAYDVTMSEDNKTMMVSVYNNYLTEISLGTEGGNGVITLTGIHPFDMKVFDEENTLVLEMNGIVNTLENLKKTIRTLDSVSEIEVMTIEGNKIYVIISKQTESKYVVKQVDNKQVITFELDKAFVGEVIPDDRYEAIIPLPKGVTYDDIEVEDRYHKKQIVFILDGDHRAFYKNINSNKNSSVISSITSKYTNKKTEVIITTTKIQGFHVYDKGTKLNVDLGNPKDMYDRIVILDAGHGGSDPGAIRTQNGVQIYEKNLNQGVLKRSEKYFNSPDSTIKVYYTIVDDIFWSLSDRAGFAKQVGADLFISLHMNAFTTASPKGTEIYYSSKNTNKLSGMDSKKFASLFLSKLPGKIGMSTRYVHDKNYVVIRDNTVPSILIELGFMSNTSDLKLLTNASVQEKTAKALYDILESIFKTYPTKR